MIILDTVNKSLEVLLSGAVTTNQLPVVGAFVDITAAAYTPGAADTQTNGATPVTAVAAPAASTQRQVKFLSVRNSDTAEATVTVSLNNNATLRVLVSVTLPVGASLIYTDGEGFRVITAAGIMLTGPETIRLPSSIASGRVPHATSDDVLGSDADLTFDGSILSVTGGYKERSRSVPMGEFTDVPFDAGNFTASGSMTWTVQSTDVVTFAYALVGKLITINFTLDQTSIGGTASNALQIAIPGGFTSAKAFYALIQLNEGSGAVVAQARVTVGGSVIQIFKMDSTTNFALTTNTTYVRGSLAFAIS